MSKFRFLVLGIAGAFFEFLWIRYLATSNLSPVNKTFLVVAGNALAVFLANILFQKIYKLRKGYAYKYIPKLSFSKMYFESHPYLPYVYKKNFKVQNPTKVNYPLNKNGLSSAPLTSNNFGMFDGTQGDRDIVVPKPENTLRVLCIGASTTGAYFKQDGIVYSYPLELERYLKKKFPDKEILVHNCGHGGWTSAELMIRFLLTLFDTDPDYIVIYHAYNDQVASLTPNFESDYSHARKNFAGVLHLYRLARFIPDIPVGVYNFVINSVFPYLNPRYGIIEAVSRGAPDLKSDFLGVKTYRRNLEHIVKVCKASGIQVVLSTYAHYLYDKVKEDPVHLKYHEGVKLENEQVCQLAEKHGLPLVDNFKQIPRKDEYFVDSIHFSPEGMKLLAENIGEALTKLIMDKEVSGVQSISDSANRLNPIA